MPHTGLLPPSRSLCIRPILCVSVCKISQKVMNGFKGFWWNFLERWSAWPREESFRFWWRSGFFRATCCCYMQQLSAKVFKLSFEYLRISSPKSGDFCRKKNGKIDHYNFLSKVRFTENIEMQPEPRFRAYSMNTLNIYRRRLSQVCGCDSASSI